MINFTSKGIQSNRFKHYEIRYLVGVKKIPATPTKQDLGTNLVPRAFSQREGPGNEFDLGTSQVLLKIFKEHPCSFYMGVPSDSWSIFMGT